MSRNRKQPRAPRPSFRAWPLGWATGLSMLAGAVLLVMGWLTRGGELVTTMVWVVLGAFMILQPLQFIIVGQGDRLRVGLVHHDLTGLSKVAVFDTRHFGVPSSTAVLVFRDRVVHLSGLFLPTRSLTALVGWLRVPTERIKGVWATRALINSRPDLAERRPA